MTTGRRSRADRGDNVQVAAKRVKKRSAPATAKPRFRELSTTEAMRVLRRNHIGRLAYTLHDLVEVQPIHYVTDGRWLYMRTSPGFKTEILERNRWLAFQTDEVESAFSWRSVMVRGSAYILSADAGPDLVARHRRALRWIRRVMPEALTAEDPVAFRTVILGVHIDSISGREAREPRKKSVSKSR